MNEAKIKKIKEGQTNTELFNSSCSKDLAVESGTPRSDSQCVPGTGLSGVQEMQEALTEVHGQRQEETVRSGSHRPCSPAKHRFFKLGRILRSSVRSSK